MLILILTAILQLVTAQDILLLSPNVIPGPGAACQSQRTAIDTAIESIHQSVQEILSISLLPQCGDGLWTRVAYLNMTDPSQQCPPSWRLYSANGVRACGRPVTFAPMGGCYSQNYTVQRSYNKVCGQIIGYQVGSPDVFGDQQLSIDEPYVDGVSVTYGEQRRHIWTFAGGLSEMIVTGFYRDHEKYTCPCALNGTAFRMQQPSAFVGNHYFCESGNPVNTFENSNILRNTNDPLWDGERCEGQCCTRTRNSTNSPPWFSVKLPNFTSEKIEVRICSGEPTNNEDTPIGLLEIYIQ